MKKELGPNQVLRAGLIGGGADKSKGESAFIALRHSASVHLGGTRRITCGALHYDPKVAIQCAAEWPYPIHGYESVGAMLEHLESRPSDERVEFVIIATPNNCHFMQAMPFIEMGIPVVLEKPMTLTVTEARQLAAAVEKTGTPLMIFHTYWGHVMTNFARFVVQSGLLGKIIGGRADYDQDWLRLKLESMGVTQAWRAKKAVCGISCCGGDIGVHGQKHWEFVTGDPVASIEDASLRTIVPDRELDDVFYTRCLTHSGAEIVIRAAQVWAGRRNRLYLEVNGTDATLIQDCEKPEEIRILRPGKGELTYYRGQIPESDEFLTKPVPKELLELSYWPGGHPEGLTDAAGHLYDAFETDVRRYYRGLQPINVGTRYAGVLAGLSHMIFLRAAVLCNQSHDAVLIEDVE